MSFAVTAAPIDREVLRANVINNASGACVIFEGWIRDHNEGRAVERLEYEIYTPIALAEGEKILLEAREKFDIEDAACSHREGMLEITDTAVLAVAVAAHRDEAFQACRYIIDEVKHRLPIWKKEYYTDGDVHWVNCLRCAEHARSSAAGPGGDSGD